MNKTLAAAIFLSLLLSTMAFNAWRPAVSQDTALRGYDWIVEIRTEELKEHLSYAGCTLKPLFKAEVSYQKTGPSGDGKPTMYEDLFFRGCEAVGCRRHHPFDIHAGDGIALRVKSKAPTPATQESCAAANAICRLLLDSYLNSNSVVSVFVPYPMFSTLVQDLNRQNFYAASEASPDVPVYSSIVVHLRSDPPGLTQTMNYTGQTSH